MIASSPIDLIKSSLCDEIEVEEIGIGKYAVHPPFTFDDGDHYVVRVEKAGETWVITDEGHTFMHMSYSDVDFMSGTRERLIKDALVFHDIECTGGRLTLRVRSDSLLGYSVFSFIQAVSQIYGVTRFTRETAKSTFLDDFQKVISEIVGDLPIAHFQWTDPVHDPNGVYVVDCLVHGPTRPWMVFALNSEGRCKDAIITTLKMQKHHPRAKSIAVFEDQPVILPKTVAQLTDAVWKSFSSLGERDLIREYFKEQVLQTAV